MPLQNTDPLGIRPSRVPMSPMMQTMPNVGSPIMGDAIGPEFSAPSVNRMRDVPQQGRAPSEEQLLSALPQIGASLGQSQGQGQGPRIEALLSQAASRSPSLRSASPPPPPVQPQAPGPPPLGQAAKVLAERGRGIAGLTPKDNMLVHMSAREVQALADASPIGGLPINPDTGMPEAFAFLLPMALGMGGSALGAAGMLGTIGALGGGAIGAGLGGLTKGLLEGQGFGDALKQGLIGGVSSYALGSLFQGIGGGATDGISQAAAGNNVGALAAQNAAGGGMMPGMGGPVGAGGGGFGGMDYGGVGTGMYDNLTTSIVNPPLPVNASPLYAPPEIGSFSTTNGPLPYSGPSYSPTDSFSTIGAMSGAAPQSGGFVNALKDQFTRDSMTSPEAMGRLAGNMVPGLLQETGGQIGAPLSNKLKNSNYIKNTPEPGDTEVASLSPDYRAGRDPQQRRFPNRTVRFQEGGLVDAGIGSLDPEGEQELVVNAKLAAMGRHPNAEAALMAFANRFGVEALRMLVRGVTLKPGEGEALEGQGGGMADLIPAVIDGEQPARLSSGEVVIPSDVVSGAGNGSTEAGAGHFQDMIAAIRMAKTGTSQQPVPIEEAMAQSQPM